MTFTRSEKEQVKKIEDRLQAIETKITRIQSIVIGIAIGVAIGAVIFGVISFKEFFNIVK